MIIEPAPAKINLYLHVGPVRRDGLHELASLFVFAEGGDVIAVEKTSQLSLRIEGPFAAALAGSPPQENLAWRAARRLQEKCGVDQGARITLEKNLPVASGVGGGSADAAATLRALVRLWRVDISEEALCDMAFRLGADVPACLWRAPVNVSGAGERMEKGPTPPPLWICLANPGVDMPTGRIFRAFDRGVPAPPPPSIALLETSSYQAFVAGLKETRNDLEPYARAQSPAIDSVIAVLDACPGALISRMSGSGATCFALFASRAAASRAETRARARGWWAMASRLHVR